MEKIGQWASLLFTDSVKQQEWMDLQEQYLLTNQAIEVVESVAGLLCQGEEKKLHDQLLTYLKNNLNRMHYQYCTLVLQPFRSVHTRVIDSFPIFGEEEYWQNATLGNLITIPPRPPKRKMTSLLAARVIVIFKHWFSQNLIIMQLAIIATASSILLNSSFALRSNHPAPAIPPININ